MTQVSTFDAISILRFEHRQITDLLSALEATVDATRPIDEQVLQELFVDLRIHSALEQQTFYPGVKPLLGSQQESTDFGRDFYLMLSLMLELQSTRNFEPEFKESLGNLKYRFQRHVEKDESMFSEIQSHSDIAGPELASLGVAMEKQFLELKSKLSRVA